MGPGSGDQNNWKKTGDDPVAKATRYVCFTKEGDIQKCRLGHKVRSVSSGTRPWAQ